MLRNIFFVFFLALLSSCASSPSNESAAVAGNRKNVQKGRTSQAEIVQMLGSPNIVTKNSKGSEVWTYTRQAYDAEKGGFNGGVVVLDSKNLKSAAASNFDLILIFNRNDVLEDYTVVQSQF